MIIIKDKFQIGKLLVYFPENWFSKYGALLLSLLMAIVYYISSIYSNGFYQHDEIAHFLGMKEFWHNPNTIIGNWAKPGFKLLFVVPALFGIKFVQLCNSLLSAACLYFSYIILKDYKSKYAFLIFFLLGLQPLWFQLAFRSYAEFTCAIALLLALRSHQKEHYHWAALFVSYASFARQELFIVTGLYFIYLCFNKRFASALLTGTFAILLHIWGWIESGNIMFLYDYLFVYPSTISGVYLNPWGLHRIPVFTIALFGAIVPILFISYLGSSILLRKKIHLIIFIPFFAVYAYYSLQDTTWFPSPTPITTRQLITVSPFLTIIAILGLDRFELLKVKQEKIFIPVIISFMAIVALYMSFDHNWTYILYKKDNQLPIIFVSLSASVLFLPLKQKTKIISFTLLAFISLGTSYKKINQTEEEKALQELANFYKQTCELKDKNKIFSDDNPVYITHPVLMYYLGKSTHDFNPPAKPIDETSVKTIEKNSLIFWDSHYSYRPQRSEKRNIQERFFIERPFEYKSLKRIISKDNRFIAHVFIKHGETDNHFENGLVLYTQKKYSEAIKAFQTSVRSNPTIYSFYYLGSSCDNLGLNQQALQYYDLCLRLQPNYLEAMLDRGILFIRLLQFNKALIDIDHYIQLSGGTEKSFLAKAIIHLNKKEYEEAIKNYLNALKFNPNNADAYFWIGYVQIQLNQKSNACANFNKALELGHKEAHKAIQDYCK